MEMEPNAQVKDELNLEGCQPQTVQPTSRALSDGSREETPCPTYKHSWTVQQRLTLTMLAESYSNNWDELTSVFNNFHKSDLRRCGGLRRVVVVTQYYDMRRKFDAAAALRQLQITLSPYERSSLASLDGLEKKAKEIDIQLKAKGSMDVSNKSGIADKHDNPVHRKRNRANPKDDSRTEFLPSESDNEERTGAGLQMVQGVTHLPETPTKINGKRQYDGLLTPPDSKKRKLPSLTAAKKLADIGFRAFTAESQGTYTSALGIRAGAFRDCPDIPQARHLSVTRYREEALHHVTKHDHSKPSMFVSATKNPMRAFHMLLHAPDGEKGLILIDLKAADESGNVEKAHTLKLQTTFRYTAAGEYLIFGGVSPRAIISYIPLSRLLSNMPTTPNDEDPFKLKVLQVHKTLSRARRDIVSDLLPMTYSLGRAVGQLMEILCVPPKQFESAVWAFVQDYKFYKAEGGKKRGHWADNVAFKDGVRIESRGTFNHSLKQAALNHKCVQAIQGYQAVQSDKLASVEIESRIETAREIIEISDSDSDSDSDSAFSDGDILVSARVKDWIRNTQASQPSLRYYDLESSKWVNKEKDLSDGFVPELGNIVGNLDSNSPKHHRSRFTQGPIAAPAGNRPNESRNLGELCADLMNMHGDGYINQVGAGHNTDTGYEFSWTGM